MHVSVAEIFARSRAALLAHGAGAWQAEAVARAVARAEETGNVICGLYYLESYCVQLLSGRVDGTVEPEVSRPAPGCVRVDARFGFAQPAFDRALPRRWRRRGKTGWRRFRSRIPTPAPRWGSSPNGLRRRG
jgi:(2R)-3-sulfolactate dehydrogenase (NADP+)